METFSIALKRKNNMGTQIPLRLFLLSICICFCLLPFGLGRPCAKAALFRCDENNTVIPQFFRCDGIADCDNGEDEENCESTVPITDQTTDDDSSIQPEYSSLAGLPYPTVAQFRCDENITVPQSFRCDGTADCVNGEDEENCESTVPITDQTTDDDSSIQPEYSSFAGFIAYLMRILQGLPYPTVAQFRCDKNHTVPQFLRCDGMADCVNGEDEENCESTVPITDQTTDGDSSIQPEYSSFAGTTGSGEAGFKLRIF